MKTSGTCGDPSAHVPANGEGCADAAEMVCPFCRSQHQEIFEIDASVWAVYCLDCEAVGPRKKLRKEALDLWISGGRLSFYKAKT